MIDADRVLHMVWPLVGRSLEMHRLEGALGEPLPRGLLISGQMGVGKSRLLAEFAERARRTGWAVDRVAGNVSSSQVPMGALAQLLPDLRLSSFELVAFHHRARRTLTERHGRSRLVLAVDDAHSLDPASAAFVAQWTALGYCLLVCTARSEEPLPAPLQGIVKDQVISTIDIGALPDEAVESLIRAALNGPVDGVTCRQLVQMVAGNPLFLREVLDHSIESGTLQVRNGCWQLVGPPSISPTLTRLTHQRMGTLTSEQSEALELLALAHPLELDFFGEPNGGSAFVDLERRHIVETVQSGRRRRVTFSHPVFAESLRSSIPELQRRRLSGRLLRLLDEKGARRREDPLRIGIWHIKSGEFVKLEHLAAAAQCANTAAEHVLAERLARAAINAGAGTEAQILLGDSVSRQGRVAEAEGVFSTIAERVDDGPTGVTLALLRAENAGMRGGNSDQGIRLLDDARREHTDAASRALLDSQLVLLHAFRPDLDRAAATARRLIESAATPIEVRIAALMSLALILIWRCEFKGASAAMAQAERFAQECEQVSADLRDRIKISPAAVWPWAGSLDRALPKLKSGYQEASTPPIGDYAGLWAHFLGQALRMSGAVKHAAAFGRDAVRLIDRVDPTGSRAMVYAQQAINLGELADSAGVDDMAARLRREPPGPPPRAAWLLIAQGWSRAVAGDIPTAISLLCRAADAALEDGIPVIAAWALYDTVRWEASEQAADLLQRTADQTTSPTINAVADHAGALLSSNPARLERIAWGYATRGENLNAFFAYSQAAHLYKGSGRTPTAARAATKAHLIASEGTQLDSDRYAALPSRLTARETEIAKLAAQGLSSKGIARRLYISVRTVDNHLASAYIKLGVHGRSELGAAITPHVGAPPHRDAPMAS